MTFHHNWGKVGLKEVQGRITRKKAMAKITINMVKNKSYMSLNIIFFNFDNY